MNNKMVAATVAGALTATLALAGCGTSYTLAGEDGQVTILAAFYPLQFISKQIGGEHVAVTTLTPQGAEPHDLELSPAHTRLISQADLVVFSSGLQPSVDDAVKARQPKHVVDAGTLATLETPHNEHGPHGSHAAGGHADGEEHSVGDGHDHGFTDPHFWLDPTLLNQAAQGVAKQLELIDPTNAGTYQANAQKLATRLANLDQQFEQGLATCGERSIVTAHEAFGYLAKRYNFEQIGISGIDPEAEPSPAQIRSVKAQIADRNITTIFFEALTSPKVTKTLASDLGITAKLLDPIEGLNDPSQDYFSVQEANLAALRSGMNCE